MESTVESSIMRYETKPLGDAEHTVHLSSVISLRIYVDSRPHNWHTANLQKGLVLVYEGMELVGEGTGFGVPVILYSDRTVFSGSSRVSVTNEEGLCAIRKEFTMNMIPKKMIKGVYFDNAKFLAASKYLVDTYQTHRHLRFLTYKALCGMIGLHTSFVRIHSVGKVIVDYLIDGGRIKVRADFREVERKKLKRFVLLNEQASRYFTKYFDSAGNESSGRHIGAWENIEADWACITDPSRRVGFRLQRPRGGIMRAGREFLRGYIDWVGLDLEFTAKDYDLAYGIEILGV